MREKPDNSHKNIYPKLPRLKKSKAIALNKLNLGESKVGWAVPTKLGIGGHCPPYNLKFLVIFQQNHQIN